MRANKILKRSAVFFVLVIISPTRVSAVWNYTSDSGYQREDGSDHYIVDFCQEKIAYKFQYTGSNGEVFKTFGGYFYGGGDVKIQIEIMESFVTSVSTTVL